MQMRGSASIQYLLKPYTIKTRFHIFMHGIYNTMEKKW